MTADIKMQWGDKKHELNVSTYHMCILLLFNEADRHSYQDILTATAIPAGDLKRALQSLALVKVSQSVCVCVYLHGWTRLTYCIRACHDTTCRRCAALCRRGHTIHGLSVILTSVVEPMPSHYE